jgi:low affinity Fe/Cu permease
MFWLAELARLGSARGTSKRSGLGMSSSSVSSLIGRGSAPNANANAGDGRAGLASGSMSERFHRLSCVVAQHVGSHWAFFAAVLLIVVWALLGPVFDFNDTWQLVINTGTTIITFLMVFLIQATQNRDSRALHLKLDELIRATQARDVFADLEDATEQELDAFQREFRELHLRGVRGMDAAVEAGKSRRSR